MADKIFEGFLRRQFEEGMALVRNSDLVVLVPVGREQPPDRYIARFQCQGLVRDDHGVVTEASGFDVGIWFPADYLRQAQPFQVLTWLGNPNIFHPNIKPPFICLGRLTPGMGLVDILHQCFEVIAYQNWAAHDGLNLEACQWARNNQERFPVDPRPLKRRSLELQCEVTGS